MSPWHDRAMDEMQPAGENPAQWGKSAGPGGPTRKDEDKFLQGPRQRGSELWRAVEIFREFMKGFRALHFAGPCVTVFGSARFKEDHRYYTMARQLGVELARVGFTTMTGGGPGIREAANRGAREAGGASLGCNLVLPEEQRENAYLDRFVVFDDFFVRKVMLVKYSYAFVVMPGGFGTLDEMFECATLMQTGKIRHFPLVLMGLDYWQPLIDFFRSRLLEMGTIAPADVDLFVLTDDPKEAVDRIREIALGQFGLTYGPRPRPKWWLGERTFGRI